MESGIFYKLKLDNILTQKNFVCQSLIDRDESVTEGVVMVDISLAQILSLAVSRQFHLTRAITNSTSLSAFDEGLPERGLPIAVSRFSKNDLCYREACVLDKKCPSLARWNQTPN